MTPEQRKSYELSRWRWAIKHMEEMIKLDAPKIIKANILIKIFLPKIIRRLNIVKEASEEITSLIMDGLAFRSTMCMSCKQVALTPDDKTDHCPKCQSEIDQMCAEWDEEDRATNLLDMIFNSDPSQDDEDEEEESDDAKSL